MAKATGKHPPQVAPNILRQVGTALKAQGKCMDDLTQALGCSSIRTGEYLKGWRELPPEKVAAIEDLLSIEINYT
jgi:hypothetical protein